MLIEAVQLRHILVNFCTLSEEQLKYKKGENRYCSRNSVLILSQILSYTYMYVTLIHMR